MENNKPKFSIIVPVFNGEKYIDKCIRSILDQTYSNIQIIVIDGCSTDDTLQIVQKFLSSPHIIVSEKDDGQAYAINKGFKIADGEYVAWLNSDDYYSHNSVIESVVFTFINSNADLVYGDGYRRYENTHILQFRDSLRNYPIGIKPNSINDIDFRHSLIQPSTFYKLSSINSVGYCNTSLNYCFDWDLFRRLSHISNFKSRFIPDQLSIYRIHPDYKTGTGRITRSFEISSYGMNNLSNDYAFAYAFINKHIKLIYPFKKYFRNYGFYFISFLVIFIPKLSYKCFRTAFRMI